MLLCSRRLQSGKATGCTLRRLDRGCCSRQLPQLRASLQARQGRQALRQQRGPAATVQAALMRAGVRSRAAPLQCQRHRAALSRLMTATVLAACTASTEASTAASARLHRCCLMQNPPRLRARLSQDLAMAATAMLPPAQTRAGQCTGAGMMIARACQTAEGP